MSWADLFDRAGAFEVSVPAVRSALSEIRGSDGTQRDAEDGANSTADRTAEAGTERDGRAVRVVAGADVLAADLLVGGDAREALDHVRRHSWVELVASDALLEDARALVADLADPDLAEDWLERVERDRVRVEHPPGDHPALASAYRGDARHLLTEDEELTEAGPNLSLQPHTSLSVRSPAAFATVFDAESLYEGLFEEPYPGPDCDPRA